MKLIPVVVGVSVLAGAAYGGYTLYRHRPQPLMQAEQALAHGKPQDALLLLRTYVRDHSESREAALLLGRTHAAMGDTTAAERDFKRARALGADRWAVLGTLAPYYLADHRYEDVLREVPSTAPEPAIAARDLAFRARAYVGLKRLPEAERTLQAATALAPHEPQVLLAAGQLAMAKNDTTTAEARADQVLAAAPADIDALMLKAEILANRNDLPDALAAMDRAVAAAPNDAAPRLSRANMLMATGQDAKALQDVEHILSVHTHDGPALYLAGVLAVRAGSWTKASEVLAALGPKAAARFPRLTYFQAEAALGQGLPASAVAFAHAYYGQVPNDPDGVRLLARAQAADGHPEQAAQTLGSVTQQGMNDAETLDQLGQARAAAGDVAGAEQAFRLALAKAPHDPAVTAHLAALDLRRGEPAQAVASLQPGGDDAHAPVGTIVALATAQIVAGDTAKAQTTLDRLRTATGQTETVGVLTGMLALARFDPNAAVEAFQTTLKAHPTSLPARLDLAKAFVLANRGDDARALWAEILATDPANPAALNSLVHFDIDAGRFSPAIKALEAARKAKPENEALTAMLSDVLVRGSDAQAAVALDRAAPGNALSVTILTALARAQLAARHPADAIATYQTALSVRPEPATALALAALQQAQADRAAAATTLDAAIRQAPGDGALLEARVRLEAAANGIQSALHLAASLRANPRHMPAAATLAGDMLLQAGQHRAAAAAFAAERAAVPGPTMALRQAQALVAAGDDAGAAAALQPLGTDPQAALLLSQIDIRAGRWPDAVHNLEGALQGRPNDPALLNDLAWAYLMVGDARARITAQHAYLLDPAPETADTLGWIMTRQNDPAAAVPLLRLASSQRPALPALRYHLAVALDKAGEGAAAATAAKAALAMPQAFAERADATALLARLEHPSATQ